MSQLSLTKPVALVLMALAVTILAATAISFEFYAEELAKTFVIPILMLIVVIGASIVTALVSKSLTF